MDRQAQKQMVYVIMEYGMEYGKLRGVYMTEQRAEIARDELEKKHPYEFMMGPNFDIEPRELIV
jgi:hypothetical protein